MAYYEIIGFLLLALLVVMLTKVTYDTGYRKGDNHGTQEWKRFGEDIGFQQGYNEGKRDGYRDYCELEKTLYEREKERTNSEYVTTRDQITLLNAEREPSEQVPYEILLAYGVSRIEDLPLGVRKAYDIKQTGGVISEEVPR